MASTRFTLRSGLVALAGVASAALCSEQLSGAPTTLTRVADAVRLRSLMRPLEAKPHASASGVENEKELHDVSLSLTEVDPDDGMYTRVKRTLRMQKVALGRPGDLFKDPVYFTAHAPELDLSTVAMPNRYKPAGPLMIMSEADWEQVKTTAREDAFGSDFAEVVVGDEVRVWVWSFPKDLNSMPGFDPIKGVVLSESKKYARYDLGYFSWKKLRVDVDGASDIHAVEVERKPVGMDLKDPKFTLAQILEQNGLDRKLPFEFDVTTATFATIPHSTVLGSYNESDLSNAGKHTWNFVADLWHNAGIFAYTDPNLVEEIVFVKLNTGTEITPEYLATLLRVDDRLSSVVAKYGLHAWAEAYVDNAHLFSKSA